MHVCVGMQKFEEMKIHRMFGIYQAEVRHLSHAEILLIMRLLEVVIPNITFKFGANNFNFIRVRLGQVRSG